MFLMMVLYYYDLLFGLYPSSLCFATTTFRGFFPHHQVKLLCWVQSIELASIGGSTQPNRVGSPDDEGRTIPRNTVVVKHKED
jgi:hypothetical protein